MTITIMLIAITIIMTIATITVIAMPPSWWSAPFHHTSDGKNHNNANTDDDNDIDNNGRALRHPAGGAHLPVIIP
jgi:hypothetical protein